MSERELTGEAELGRILWRLSKELQERHPGEELVLCGIITRGAHLARRLSRLVQEQGGPDWRAVSLDPGPYRDDRPRPAQGMDRPAAATRDDVEGHHLVLVDDVLFHGRTARAALAALAALGRPLSVELLVLVDRGHRELPLRATYVGRNLPTSEAERVQVRLRESDGEDGISLLPLALDRAARG